MLKRFRIFNIEKLKNWRFFKNEELENWKIEKMKIEKHETWMLKTLIDFNTTDIHFQLFDSSILRFFKFPIFQFFNSSIFQFNSIRYRFTFEKLSNLKHWKNEDSSIEKLKICIIEELKNWRFEVDWLSILQFSIFQLTKLEIWNWKLKNWRSEQPGLGGWLA